MPQQASARIAPLAEAATKHGLGLRPRAVALQLQLARPGPGGGRRPLTRLLTASWRRIEGLRRGACAGGGGSDAECEGWGLRVDAFDAVHWFVVDTRR